MARQKQGSFKMKGHTLPGINQKSETVNIKDGRSPSSAFQMAEPGYESEVKYEDLDEKGKKIWNDLRKKKKDE